MKKTRSNLLRRRRKVSESRYRRGQLAWTFLVAISLGIAAVFHLVSPSSAKRAPAAAASPLSIAQRLATGTLPQ